MKTWLPADTNAETRTDSQRRKGFEMKCCDVDCNQGRCCPNRVARIKIRYPMHPSYEPESWREYLPGIAGFILSLIFSLLLGIPLAYLITLALF